MRVDRDGGRQYLVLDNGEYLGGESKIWDEVYFDFFTQKFTRSQLRSLLPHLQAWVETGSLELPKESQR